MKKYQGAGNSFLILFESELNGSKENFITRYGQETDGVIFVSKTIQHFRMDFYNRDASQADFCGNGSRCFLKFLYDNQKITLSEDTEFETGYGTLHGQLLKKNYAMIEMPAPTKEKQLLVEGYSGFFITVGVPHFVIFLDTVERLENLDLPTEGFKIRNSPVFLDGTNVDFVAILSREHLRIRTFERGVEGETKACGSGSTASAVVFASQFQTLRSSILITTNGGILKVSFERNKIVCSGGIENV
jgi:diaminopimelate epimerase